MSMSTDTVDNGVNVDALLEARKALEEMPEAAQFKWRATCSWKNGTHSHSTVKGFFGLGEEQKHKTEFKFDADHPEIFAAEDNGATPGRICPGRPGQLPDCRCRRSGPSIVKSS